MAMILEIVDPRRGEVTARHRLGSLPFTVGRGYGNDLILDDPYVDAEHVRVLADEAGALWVEDLGSTNGTVVSGRPLHAGRAVAGPGAEVRVGRTLLRFRDPAEPVPAAIPVVERRVPQAARWLSTPRGRLAIYVTAVGAVAATAWLESYQRSSASVTLGVVLVLVLVGSGWAGLWAAASRMAVHRSHFREHLAVTAASALAGIILSAVHEWAEFLVPDSAAVGVAAALVGFAVAAAMLAAHLALASGMTRRQRWKAGLTLSGLLLVISGTVSLAERESFTDVPEFSALLKPVPARWLPTVSVEEFGRAAAELKREVDALGAGE